jgi:hypothetical protein
MSSKCSTIIGEIRVEAMVIYISITIVLKCPILYIRVLLFTVQNPKTYMTHGDSRAVLKFAVSSLGISHYAMAKLLQVRHSNYSRWFSQYRPSSVYLGRICIIFCMASKGLRLPLVDYIDWVNGTIKYKKGVADAGSNLLSEFGWLSKKESEVGTVVDE